MIDSGPDNPDMNPLAWDGTTEENFVGCHRGSTADMNIANPEPGKYYLWVNSRHHGTQVRIEQWGYRRANPAAHLWRSDPTNPDVQQVSPDTGHHRGDCVLYEIDEASYRRMRAYKEAKAARMRGDIGVEYERSDRALSLQERYGGGSKPILYRAPGHGIRRAEYSDR